MAVGAIARFYGVAVLGLIVLTRSFLPSGFLTLFDFGVSELATQAVARGRVGDWNTASEKVTLLTLIAGMVGLVSAVVLYLAAAPLCALFKVSADHAGAFVSILAVTAFMLPIAFLGLIAEGILKGLEEYGWLRLTEVIGNALYVAAVYVMVWRGEPFETVAYAYLAMTVAKYLVLAVVVQRLARETPLRFAMWGGESRRDILHRCWLMFNARIGGILQQPVVPLAIGALFSPVEVGTYDVLTRLTRFLKTVMSPLYSAILPLSTQIEETTDTRRLQILGRNGLVLPSAVVIPILTVIALFSDNILKVWVGPDHADQWPWFALSLLVPAVTVLLGAGQTALMVRADFLRLNTRYLYVQVLIQYAVTAVAVVWFRERAFILGWVVSFVASAPFIARRMLAHMDLPSSLFWEQVGRQALVAAILTAMALAYRMSAAGADGLLALVIVGGLGCVAAWGLSATLILSASDRAMFGRFARAIAQRK
jgi:O-antigen/teichoic acid export membrane protein